eukprot:SAG22_NODE_183_length_16031_cov_36.647000_10_plen_261_part_00
MGILFSRLNPLAFRKRKLDAVLPGAGQLPPAAARLCAHALSAAPGLNSGLDDDERTAKLAAMMACQQGSATPADQIGSAAETDSLGCPLADDPEDDEDDDDIDEDLDEGMAAEPPLKKPAVAQDAPDDGCAAAVLEQDAGYEPRSSRRETGVHLESRCNDSTYYLTVKKDGRHQKHRPGMSPTLAVVPPSAAAQPRSQKHRKKQPKDRASFDVGGELVAVQDLREYLVRQRPPGLGSFRIRSHSLPAGATFASAASVGSD